jgi:hypothetical protein
MNINLTIPEPALWVLGTIAVIIIAKLAMEFFYPGN